MEYRRLGSTGMYVSEIAYGNWITHGSQVEAAGAKRCVKAALDVGITTFDTADVYANTHAEEILGGALKGVKRENYELCTKVYFPTGQGKNNRGLSRKHIMESAHASLKRLKTDHIDLYYMHRFDHETPIDESLQAFEDLVRQGKVNYIGFSEWNSEQIKSALNIQKARGWTKFVANQPQYSMLWRVIERHVLPLSQREGIGQIAFSPLAQGVLTGKYLPGKKPPTNSRATDKKSGADMISGWLRPEVLTAVQKLKPIADSVGVSLSQLALSWVLAQPGVSAVVMGASTASQVTENARASGIKLDSNTIKLIDEVLGSLPERNPAHNQSPNPRA